MDSLSHITSVYLLHLKVVFPVHNFVWPFELLGLAIMHHSRSAAYILLADGPMYHSLEIFPDF